MTLDYRKLPETESFALFPKRGQMDLADYIAMLNNANDGDVIEVRLYDTTMRSMKRRIGMAARHAGRTVKFTRRPTSNEHVVFQVHTKSKALSKKSSRQRKLVRV